MYRKGTVSCGYGGTVSCGYGGWDIFWSTSLQAGHSGGCWGSSSQTWSPENQENQWCKSQSKAREDLCPCSGSQAEKADSPFICLFMILRSLWDWMRPSPCSGCSLLLSPPVWMLTPSQNTHTEIMSSQNSGAHWRRKGTLYSWTELLRMCGAKENAIFYLTQVQYR